MLEAVWVGAAAWVMACVAFAWRFPREVARAGDARWRAQLERELEGATDDRDRILLVNEALDEAEQVLERGRRWPEVAGWLSLGGVTMAMAAGATWRPDPSLLWALPFAVVGVVASHLAGRLGRARVARRRDAIDGVVDEVCGGLVDVEVVLPGRRRQGEKGSRGRRRRG